MSDEALRRLPRVDRVLGHPLVAEVQQRLGPAVKPLVRAVIDEARRAVRAGAAPIDEEAAASRVVERASAWSARRTQRVINATGVILHTNLGRAPLSDAAAQAVAEGARGYVSLELDLASGKRGGRAAFVEGALVALTGAEAALVVNNNAAAVLLALAALALGKSVVVSRGELVEIGGGFRVPEVLLRSGARLVEVGTTNRTKLSDYERALDEAPDVAAILHVHPGNFRQTGFVEAPELADLAELAQARGVRLVCDLGGGALADLSAHGLVTDPLVRDLVETGADLVTFSTDKILGGPQGGALVGTRAAVDAARRDPLARALRVGRLPLLALEATLDAWLREDHDGIPAVRMARIPAATLRDRAARWAAALAPQIACEVVATRAVAGGGTYSGDEIASWAIALRAADADAFTERLRRGSPAVVARIEDGVVVLDARTVGDDEDDALLDAIRRAAV